MLSSIGFGELKKSFEKKSKIFEICVVVHSEGKNLMFRCIRK